MLASFLWIFLPLATEAIQGRKEYWWDYVFFTNYSFFFWAIIALGFTTVGVLVRQRRWALAGAVFVVMVAFSVTWKMFYVLPTQP